MAEEQIQIHGTCAPGFEPVREAFAANFAERDEIGASVAVAAAGQTVVNMWAGWADPAHQRLVHHQGDDVPVRARPDRPR